MKGLSVAVGGLIHESSSFAPQPASLAAFQAGGVGRGGRLLRLASANTAMGGFLAEAVAAEVSLRPLLLAFAEPSGPVTRDAFDTLGGELLSRLAEAGPLDALFLDLHGAMLVEDSDDGEGELLARVRGIVGPDLPVICALDFHANVSAEMVALSDGMTAYRTYPHVDAGETGRRAFALLKRRLAHGRAPGKAFLQGGYLTPTVAQCTEVAPMRGLQALSPALQAADPALWSCDLLAGFPLADTPCCGAAAIAYADTQAAADAAATALADAYRDAEPSFDATLLSPQEAVAAAKRALGAGGQGPVVLADTQDNPGGGGPGDTTGLLHALLEARVERAALGVLTDAAAAAAAHAAGVGATISASLGAKLGGAEEAPVAGDMKVLALSDGRGVYRGPFLRGSGFSMGPAAALRIEGVTVIVSSHPLQCADREMFRLLGVEPEAMDVVAVKSSVHFRADFSAMARAIIVVKAPGPVKADHGELTYRRLRPGVRPMPRRA